MHIILGILKIIGIILLVLLVQILIIQLLILFVPVRYDGKVTTGGDITATRDLNRISVNVEASWLFKLLYFRYEVKQKKSSMYLRAGWIRLYPREEKDKAEASAAETRPPRESPERMPSTREPTSREPSDQTAQTRALSGREQPRARGSSTRTSSTGTPSMGIQSAGPETGTDARLPEEADAYGETGRGQAEGPEPSSDAVPVSDGQPPSGEKPVSDGQPPSGEKPVSDGEKVSDQRQEAHNAADEERKPEEQAPAADGGEQTPSDADPASLLRNGIRWLKERIAGRVESLADRFRIRTVRPEDRVPGAARQDEDPFLDLPERLARWIMDVLRWFDRKVDELVLRIEGAPDTFEELDTVFGWVSRSYYRWLLESIWKMLEHLRVRRLDGHLYFGAGRPDLTGVAGGVLWTALTPDERRFDFEPDFYGIKFDADMHFLGHFRFCLAAWLALKIACRKDTWMMRNRLKNRRRQNNG